MLLRSQVLVVAPPACIVVAVVLSQQLGCWFDAATTTKPSSSSSSFATCAAAAAQEGNDIETTTVVVVTNEGTDTPEETNSDSNVSGNGDDGLRNQYHVETMVVETSGETTTSMKAIKQDVEEDLSTHEVREKGKADDNLPPDAWRATEYPNPNVDPTLCRTIHTKRFCDPNRVLRDDEVDALETALSDLGSIKNRRSIIKSSCTTNPSSRSSDGEDANHEGDGDESNDDDGLVEIQYGVAIVRRIASLRPKYRRFDDDDEYDSQRSSSGAAVAEAFGKHVHDAWGVGLSTSCGGTGVLLFLSDLDRRIYVSRGSALESVLTDSRLDIVISNMKPMLQRRNYGEAITHALYEIDEYIQQGEPTFWEHMSHFASEYIGLLYVGMMFLFAGRSIYNEQQQRRTYATVASHLTELDQQRAEALQGRFRTKSCPICLENFQDVDESAEGSDDGDEHRDDTDAVGSMSGGSVPGGASENLSTGVAKRLGSDGLPLKLLRCGHVFDQTCWTEWVNSGQGQVHKCPVCNANVAPSEDTSEVATATARDTNASSTDNVALWRDNDDSRWMHTNEDATRGEEAGTGGATAAGQRQSSAMSRYNMERAFRLSRLATRYPRYISTQQIQRWTQSTYDGSLTRDPTFMQSDPSRPQPPSSSSPRGTFGGHSSSASFGGGGGGFGCFGGGSSGGGRGGSW